jgi:acetyl esterase/lipase
MPSTIFKYQPLKALYTLLAVLVEALRFPLWVILYLPSSGRPHRSWSHKQAIRVRIVKAFLKHSSAVQVKTPQDLKPGPEKERFVAIEPEHSKYYKGLLEDREIKPEKIGVTWTPKPLGRGEVLNPDLDIVLHFHGGAYVIGDGRDHDTGFLAKTFLKHGKVTHVVTPQYRLSSNPGGRFPAAFQDAVTSYAYLVHTLKVPADRITISGDSAGGNLALALLRYIAEFGKEVDLPWPGCIWLWSPWVDVEAGRDPANINQSSNEATDYLGGGFGQWGSDSFAPKGKVDSANPYLTPLGNAFASRTPIWIQTGDAEVLYDDDVEIASQFKKIAGNTVELEVTKGTPHDIILVGHLLGFNKEASEAAKKASEFLRRERAKL